MKSPTIFFADNFSLNTKYPTNVAMIIHIALEIGNTIIEGMVFPISVIMMFIKNNANANKIPQTNNFLFKTGSFFVCSVGSDKRFVFLSVNK